MKSYTWMVGCAGLLVAIGAHAQNKISGTIQCADKPVQSLHIEVGDWPGHVMQLEKGACTYDEPIKEAAGDKVKDSYYVGAVDSTPTHFSVHGYSVTTRESGDKTFVAYHGKVPLKDGKPAGDGRGTWAYTGGTGKLKGIQGKGSYTVIQGTGTIQIEGDYQLPASKRP